MRKVAIVFLFVSALLNAQNSKRGKERSKDPFVINFNLGVKALDERNYTKADSFFTIALKYNKSADAYYNRASARQNMGNKLGFCEDIEMATRLGDEVSKKFFDKYCVRIDTTYFKNGIKELSNVDYDYYEIRKSCTENSNVYITRKNDQNKEIRSYMVVNGDTTELVDYSEPVSGCEEMPSFKGGDEAMMRFITSRIIYPIKERDKGIAGTVYLTFVVEKDGALSDIKVLRGVENGPGLDAEAVRIIHSMPKWIPGRKNGKSVRVQYNFPVRFTLR